MRFFFIHSIFEAALWVQCGTESFAKQPHKEAFVVPSDRTAVLITSPLNLEGFIFEFLFCNWRDTMAEEPRHAFIQTTHCCFVRLR